MAIKAFYLVSRSEPSFKANFSFGKERCAGCEFLVWTDDRIPTRPCVCDSCAMLLMRIVKATGA